MKRITRSLLALFLLAVLVTFTVAPVQAITYYGPEDPVDGFVGPLLGPVPPLPEIIVASDGEETFDPFGAGFDTSDGIVLNENWAIHPDYQSSFGPDLWQLIPNTYTWVFPWESPYGQENEPTYEPPGVWYFIPGGQWDPGTETYHVILDEDGITWSDLITLDNSGPLGEAAIRFQSDPVVPEPATVLLLGSGLVGLAGFRKKFKK